MYAVQAQPVHLSASSAMRDAHSTTTTTTMSRVSIAALLRPDGVDKFNLAGRTYYRFRNYTYCFPADEVEYERLDIMHQLIYIVALNNRPHLAHLRASPRRILDIGYGTGFWMADAENLYPQAEIIGIDLDNKPQLNAGPNCAFRSGVDFNAPQWPVEDSSVDLVHIGQLLGCVPDWLQHYRKAYRCLRPGTGHLEHVEVDWCPRTTDFQLPAQATDLYNWWQWIRHASEISGKSLAYRDDTENLLEAAGFRDVSHRRIRVPLTYQNQTDPYETALANGYMTAMSHRGTQTFHGFSMPLLTTYLGWTPQQVQDLCDGVVRFLQRPDVPPQLYVNLHIWTARRPQT